MGGGAHRHGGVALAPTEHYALRKAPLEKLLNNESE